MGAFGDHSSKRASTVADPPRTASWDHVVGGAKHGMSTVIPAYIFRTRDGLGTISDGHFEGASHLPRTRSSNQSNIDAPFSSFVSTNACTYHTAQLRVPAARLCSGWSVGAYNGQLLGENGCARTTAWAGHRAICPQPCAFRAIARACALNAKRPPMHAHVI